MKILLIVMPFLFISCTSYVRTLSTRMISSETQGGLGHGGMEARLQASKRDKLNFLNERVDNSVQRFDTVYGLGGLAEVGFFERFDLFVLTSPTLIGAKYQLIGSPRLEAKKGNFSTSLVLGYGSRSDESNGNDDLEDLFNDNIDRIEVDTQHEEIGLVAGYRWSDLFLHYANVTYLHETVEGKVTTDSGTLTDARYSFAQDGMIYSTGFILYFAKAHWKVDYSHMTSDWTRTQKTTINTLNTAIGFNW